VFRKPELLGLNLPPQAESDLDVFNLPYVYEGPTVPDKEFFAALYEFRNRFFEGKPGAVQETDVWSACGRG